MTEVPLMVQRWRKAPLSERLAQAERNYRVPREHPALSGMAESLERTAWRHGVEPEALKAYMEGLSE